MYSEKHNHVYEYDLKLDRTSISEYSIANFSFFCAALCPCMGETICETHLNILHSVLWLHKAITIVTRKGVPVNNAQTAVHSFAVCVHNVNEWMSQLNPTKTQVIWLGSDQQLKHVDINDIPVLSTTVPVVERAYDL